MIGIAVFVGGFGLWAALAPLSTAAVGPGQIKVRVVGASIMPSSERRKSEKSR